VRYFTAYVDSRPFSLPWLALAFLLAFGGLVVLLGPILTPFLAGALLAYMFDPLVGRLEARGIPRATGTTVVIVLTGLGVFALLLVALPLFQGQFAELSQRVPPPSTCCKPAFCPGCSRASGITSTPTWEH